MSKPRLSSRRLKVSVGIGFFMICVGIFGLFVLTVPVELSRQAIPAPGVETKDLRPGVWSVWQSTSGAAGSVQFVLPSEIRIIGTQGPIAVECVICSRQILSERDLLGQVEVFRFVISESGPYTFALTNMVPSEVTVGLSNSNDALLKGTLYITSLVGIAAIVIPSVVTLRRRRPKTSITPAGWYPDPSSPGVYRWYDGSQWVDVNAPPTDGHDSQN